VGSVRRDPESPAQASSGALYAIHTTSNTNYAVYTTCSDTSTVYTTCGPNSTPHTTSAPILRVCATFATISGVHTTPGSRCDVHTTSCAISGVRATSGQPCRDAPSLLYLLPWALQEEVVRNPDLTRQGLFSSFGPLFRLVVSPRSDGINQRFRRKDIVAVTFAEDSVWPRTLNNALLLIHFIIVAAAQWSFSRLGTHCLENFFGFVRQNARADDRAVTALRLIARTTLVSITMHDLGIKVVHRGRDNVGAGDLSEAFAALAGLAFNDTDPVLDEAGLIDMLQGWEAKDTHHNKDAVHEKNFTKSAANAKISARNAQAGLSG
jgi:hypothetical protein